MGMDNYSAQLEIGKSPFAKLNPSPLSDQMSLHEPPQRQNQVKIPVSEKKPQNSTLASEMAMKLSMPTVPRKLVTTSTVSAHGVVMETYSNGSISSSTHLEGCEFVPGLFNSSEEHDSIVRVHSDSVYVARKTTMKKAASLIGKSDALSGHFAQIVASFAKESGSHYVVCRLDRAHLFDANIVSRARKLGNPRIRYVNKQEMSASDKAKAARSIVGRLSSLHKSGLLLGRFRTASVAFYDGFDTAQFTDPRFISEAGDSAVPEAMLSMAVLRLSGLLDEGQMLHLARYYLLDAGGSIAAAKYFSDRTNVDRETAKAYSSLFSARYGKQLPGQISDEGQLSALFVSKSISRFVPLAQMFGMS
jgi:hypothetical protein